jgi:hypothetical protein
MENMEIKNCIKCGEEAALFQETRSLQWYVSCLNLDCDEFGSGDRFPTQEEAIQAWNQRV